MSVNDSELVTGIELLKTEMETFWAKDDRGRIQGPDHLVIAASTCGQAVAIGSEIPDTLANDLQRTVARLPARSDPAMPPASLERCKELLRDAVGDVELSSGPSYLIPPTVTYEPTAALEQSAPANAETVTGASPRSWSVEEGDELLGGVLWAIKNAPRITPRPKGELIGPWVMATHNGQAIAICHTAAWSPRGAEAGVWTHPAFRGRGHAAAVTAAWASLAAPGDRRLFYGTDASNLSSQRVAARLNLRHIGWLWKLSRPTAPSIH